MGSRDYEKATYCQEGADQENSMDTNNWRPTPPSGEPTMDSGDWRTTLQPDSRQRIVNKIMDILKRHLPFASQEGLNELRKFAVRFEEKIFTAASSQTDYLRRISLKMLRMEAKSQNTMPNTGNNSKPPDPGSMPTMQPNNMTSLQHNSSSSLPGFSTAQQTVLNSQQPGSSLDLGQGNSLGSMQQVAPGTLQQNPVSTSQQANISSLPSGPSQTGLVLQQNMNPLQSSTNMFQHQHLKQQQELQKQQLVPMSFVPFVPTPQTVQMYQCQMEMQRQQQLVLCQMQRQERVLQQYLDRLAEQQSPAKIKTDELPHSHLMDIDAGNGMSTMSIPPLHPGFNEANALTTDLGKLNIKEQPHDHMVNMAKVKPMSPGEDCMQEIFYTQTGMSNAEKMRFCLSASVILAVLIFLIFNVDHQY